MSLNLFDSENVYFKKKNGRRSFEQQKQVMWTCSKHWEIPYEYVKRMNL